MIFVISGPSGSGKTSLLEGLLKSPEFKKRLSRSVSFTTRPRRSSERNLKDYFFISLEEFRRKKRQKKLLEWTKYLGYYYATPRDLVEKKLRSGRHVALCLDLKGASRIKRLYPESAVTIFVMPPDLKALRNRIAKRCSRTGEDEIARRIKLARDELKGCRYYDHCLINRNFNRTLDRMKRLVLKAMGSVSN